MPSIENKSLSDVPECGIQYHCQSRELSLVLAHYVAGVFGESTEKSNVSAGKTFNARMFFEGLPWFRNLLHEYTFECTVAFCEDDPEYEIASAKAFYGKRSFFRDKAEYAIALPGMPSKIRQF